MQVRNVVRNVTAHVALLVGPELPPTRAEQHDCTLWDASVNALPSLDVCGRYLIVRIVFALFSHVHNHGRTNEAGKWDLVHGRFAFREMNRAVDMGTAMLTRSISASGIPRACLGLSPTLFLPVKGFGIRPVDGALIKTVGQVNQFGSVQCKGHLCSGTLSYTDPSEGQNT